MHLRECVCTTSNILEIKLFFYVYIKATKFNEVIGGKRKVPLNYWVRNYFSLSIFTRIILKLWPLGVFFCLFHLSFQQNQNINKEKKNLTYLCVLEIMPPKRSDLVLATHIPNRETDIFVFYSLHIETFIGEAKRKNIMSH